MSDRENNLPENAKTKAFKNKIVEPSRPHRVVDLDDPSFHGGAEKYGTGKKWDKKEVDSMTTGPTDEPEVVTMR